jgi:hypothetical protein
MLNTVIDFEVFNDFCNRQPQKYIGDDFDKQWASLLEYLKSGSNVTITNYQNQYSLLLTQLTTGREGTQLRTETKFNKPPEYKFQGIQDMHTVFFINEPDVIKKEMYLKQNGLFFAFKDNYFEKWRELSYFGKKDELNIRKDFKSWDILGDYTLPFTDVLIYDDYIFSKKDRIAPFLPNLVDVIDKKTPVPFNLLVVTHKVDEIWGNWADKRTNTPTKIFIDKIFNDANKYLSERKLKAKLGIIILDRPHKKKERRIFFNYFKVKTGDSFYNFFDENGKVTTKASSIDFKKYVNQDYHNNAIFELKEIKHSIQPILKNKRLRMQFSYGNLKNNLLDSV